MRFLAIESRPVLELAQLSDQFVNVSGKMLQGVKLSIGLFCARITEDCCCNSTPLLVIP